MSKKYDTVVFICRAQPLHNAHVEIIRRAKSLADNLVIIIGSAYQPRTYKNPFTTEERVAMISNIATRVGDPYCSVKVDVVRDTMYNNQVWATRIQSIASKHATDPKNIAIIGHDKDASTFYLKLFPQWTHEDVELIEPLNATDIRDLYFRKDAHEGFIRHVVPESVFEFLAEFKKTDAYQQVIREREFIESYKKQYASYPYPPIFVTVDAIVICSGHVLMIRRRSEPGKGLLALPGGFVNADTDANLQDAMIRELREETGIKVPVPVLVGNIQDTKVFDAIGRSARGRTITNAYKITLPDGELPRVRGHDDAEKAIWMPISEISSEECFEDHAHIIDWAVGS